MIATNLKENATRKMAPGLGPKNSATGTEKIFRALLKQRFVARSMLNKCAKFHGDSPSGKKLNSISRERLNFGDGRFCVQLCIKTLCKRATSVAYLTNFSLEFFYKIFTEDASLSLLYHDAKKSKMTKNSNQGGPALRQDPLDLSFCHF